ncbi:MAG: hypothetical protein ACOH5I_07305 [Oligoflexus sp.]
MSGQQYKRKLSNYLLQPLVQVKLGLYAIVLALGFCLGMIGVFYVNFYRFYDMILELTDLRDEVTLILDSYIQGIFAWVVVGTLIYFVLTVLMSVFYTHRLVGPTYAFRRHIQELSKGNYRSRVCLRKTDSFSEVAEDLNQLAEFLETRAKREPPPHA